MLLCFTDMIKVKGGFHRGLIPYMTGVLLRRGRRNTACEVTGRRRLSTHPETALRRGQPTHTLISDFRPPRSPAGLWFMPAAEMTDKSPSNQGYGFSSGHVQM